MEKPLRHLLHRVGKAAAPERHGKGDHVELDPALPAPAARIRRPEDDEAVGPAAEQAGRMGLLLAELDRHPGVEDEVLQLDLLANLLANLTHAVEAGGEDLGHFATEGDQPAPAVDLGLAETQVLLPPAIDQMA